MVLSPRMLPSSVTLIPQFLIWGDFNMADIF